MNVLRLATCSVVAAPAVMRVLDGPGRLGATSGASLAWTYAAPGEGSERAVFALFSALVIALVLVVAGAEPLGRRWPPPAVGTLVLLLAVSALALVTLFDAHAETLGHAYRLSDTRTYGERFAHWWYLRWAAAWWNSVLLALAAVAVSCFAAFRARRPGTIDLRDAA